MPFADLPMPRISSGKPRGRPRGAHGNPMSDEALEAAIAKAHPELNDQDRAELKQYMREQIPELTERDYERQVRFQEHEEDRAKRAHEKEEAHEERKLRREETKQRLDQGAQDRLWNRMDRYQREIDRLEAEKLKDTTGEPRQKEIDERVKFLNGEYQKDNQRFNLNQTLIDNPGYTKAKVIEDLNESMKSATPEKLAQLQQRSDSMGLNVAVHAAPVSSLQSAEQPGGDSATRSMAQTQPVNPNFRPRQAFDQSQPLSQSYSTGGPSGAQAWSARHEPFADRDLSSMQSQAPGYVQPPRAPEQSAFSQAGENVSNIGKNLAESAKYGINQISHGNIPYPGSSGGGAGASFFEGDFPQDMSNARQSDLASIRETAQPRSQGWGETLFGLDSARRALGAVGGMFDLGTGGSLGAASNRVGRGVEANTGSHTAGQGAEIAAGLALPYGAFKGLGAAGRAFAGAAEAPKPPGAPLGLPKPSGGPTGPSMGSGPSMAPPRDFGPGMTSETPQGGPMQPSMEQQPIQLQQQPFAQPTGPQTQGNQAPQLFDTGEGMSQWDVNPAAGPRQMYPRGYEQAMYGQHPPAPAPAQPMPGPSGPVMYGRQEVRPQLAKPEPIEHTELTPGQRMDRAQLQERAAKVMDHLQQQQQGRHIGTGRAGEGKSSTAKLGKESKTRYESRRIKNARANDPANAKNKPGAAIDVQNLFMRPPRSPQWPWDQ